MIGSLAGSAGTCRRAVVIAANARSMSSGVNRTTLRSSSHNYSASIRNVACAAASPDDNAGGADDDGASVASSLSNLRFNKDLKERAAASSSADATSGASTSSEDGWPEHLKDMRLGDDGRLVDGRTGQAINGLGASRFDVAVAALRGDLDPKPWEDNTERAEGVLMQSLLTFPAAYTFTVVGRCSTASGASTSSSDADSGSGDESGGASHGKFVDDVVATVARITETPLPLADGKLAVTPRLGGKFVSLSVTVDVRAPEIVFSVCSELKRDKRVKMAF